MPEPIPHNEPTLSDDRDLLQQVLVLEDLMDGDEIEILQSAIHSVDCDTVLSSELRCSILQLWRSHCPPANEP